MICAVMTGCGKPKHEGKDGSLASNNAQNKPKKPDVVAIATGQANDTRTDLKTGQKMWFIAWESANLALVNGQQSGMMFKVTGEAYDKGVIASTFIADHAEADRAADRLILDGGIKITSKTSQAVMTAKKVEWLADLKVFKASGDVLLDSPQGVVGPVDVLYADAKLKKVASSKEYFKK